MVEIIKEDNCLGKVYPLSFHLDIRIDTKNIAETYELIYPIIIEAGIPPAQEWEIPVYGEIGIDNLEEKIRNEYSQTSSRFIFNNSITGYILQDLREEFDPEVWLFPDLECVGRFQLAHHVRGHTTVRDLQHFLQQAVEICRQVLQQAHVYKATLQRIKTSSFAPATPIVSHSVHLVLTTAEEVEASYTDPQVFWNAGWSSIEQFGNQFLLARALDQVGEIDFKQEVYPYQWDLARAAKPGLTKYYDPNPRPEEEFLLYDDVTELMEQGYSSEEIGSMLIDGEVEGKFPGLRQLGYSESEQFLKYTCAIPSEDHILPWEIYKLRYLLKQKEIAGHPLKTVQVLFPNRQEAEKEKRPLLDIGAQVLYLDDRGEEQQLTE